jgi:tetratricopeptide (TPR) repeat protein
MPLRLHILAWMLFFVVGCRYTIGQDSLYARGHAAFVAHDWETAAKLMTEADRAAPGQTDALVIAAKAYVYLNKWSEADRLLTAYLTYHSDVAGVLYLLGMVEEREDKPSESLAILTRAAKLQTPSSEQLRIVGLDYVLLNDYPDAIHWLEGAVQMDDGNSNAWYSLGRSYYTQSRFRDAEQAFRKTLVLDPANIKATENLGLVCEAENKVDEADTFFQAATTLANKNPQADEWPYLDYGDFLLNRDRAQEAIPPLENAVRINPKCAACHEKLGRALDATGQLEKGISQLESAVALSEDDAHLHYELGLAYRKAGFKDRAKRELSLSQKLYGTKTPASQK